MELKYTNNKKEKNKFSELKWKVLSALNPYQSWIQLGVKSILIAFVLYLVSASPIVCGCGFAASIIYEVFSEIYNKNSYLKYLAFVPMVIPFFCQVQLFLSGLSVFIFILMIRSWKRATRKIEWVSGVLLPLGMYFTIEYLQQNTRAMWLCFFTVDNIVHYGHLYGLLIIVAVAALLHLFLSKRLSWYITIGVFSIFAIINFFVVAFTAQGLIPSDVKLATTAIGVLDSQTLTSQDITRLIVGILCIIALIVFNTLVFSKEKKDNRTKKQKRRVFAAVTTLIICTCLTCSWFKDNMLWFEGHSKYGFITNFVINLDSKIHFPEGVEDYVVEDKDIGESNSVQPNVIMVMNEAFSDLNGVFGLNGEDNLAYFNSLKEKFPSGVAYSSVKGNNTCSSEWESLSSVSTALTTKGAIVYRDNCIPMNSIVDIFNRRGYYTLGVHPYKAPGYRRNKMWENLGFEESIFVEDFKNPDILRKYVTDKENYEMIIRQFEEHEKDQPFFCYNITMMNHGGYNIEYDDVIPYTTTRYSDVNQYLSLVNEADQQLKVLIEYFEKVDEPTVIMIFGDHQPAITNSFYEEQFRTNYNELSLEQLSEVYKVPYLIWANYDLNANAAPDEVSINYLSSVLFDVANLQTTTWMETVRDFRESWPVVTTHFAKDKDGNIFSLKEAKENEILHQYLMHSYAILKGKQTQ